MRSKTPENFFSEPSTSMMICHEFAFLLLNTLFWVVEITIVQKFMINWWASSLFHKFLKCKLDKWTLVKLYKISIIFPVPIRLLHWIRWTNTWVWEIGVQILDNFSYSFLFECVPHISINMLYIGTQSFILICLGLLVSRKNQCILSSRMNKHGATIDVR